MDLKKSIKELLEKAKASFNAPVIPVAPVIADSTIPAAAPAAPAAPAPQPFKLKDGTDITISIDDPAVSMEPDMGDAVMIAGAPAPDGELELEDGTKITVAGGIISQVTPIAPATQPDFAVPAKPSLEERLQALEAELAKLKQPGIPAGCASAEQFETVKSQFETAKSENVKNGEVIKDLFAIMDELIKEPSAAPATLNGNQKERFEKMSAIEKRVEARAAALKASKNKNNNPVLA